MGEARRDALRINFSRKLKPEFQGVKVTSDAGLLAHRELDKVFGFTSMREPEVADIRTEKNTQYDLVVLL